MILALKTDQQQTEFYLLDDSGEVMEQDVDEIGNRLSREILQRIERLLMKRQAGFGGVTGIVVYTGPGSFTGLRIGVTVANTLAYAYHLPVAGSTGIHWREEGVIRLQEKKPGEYILPEYGGDANITQPRK